ncbi:MAG: T9SS type A sorting domain-containing protein [Candidatus Eisenbacteria bacterium]|nr:T9SS type A sorting domain-containing protein [Candidatus Eisenbacteria bacterium]
MSCARPDPAAPLRLVPPALLRATRPRPPRSFFPGIAALTVAFVCAAPAHALWQPGGNLIDSLGHGTRLHPVTGGSVARPESDSSCLVLVVSRDPNCCCWSKLQRLSASGSVQDIPLPSGAVLRDAVADGQGGVLALLGCTDLRLLKILADGSVAPGWPGSGVAIGSLGSGGTLRMMADGAGGAYVTWDIFNPSPFPGVSTAIMVQHVSGSGAVAVAGGAIAVSPVATVNGTRGLDMVPDGGVGAILVFEDGRNSATSGTDIFAQRVDAALTRLWGNGGAAVCTAPLAQLGPVALGDGAGGALVLWRDRRSGAGEALYAARLGPDGLPVAGWAGGGVFVRPGTALYDLHLVGAGTPPSGGVGAIVGSQDVPYGGAAHLHLDRVHADGSVDTLWHPAVIQSALLSSGLVPDGSGGAFLSWLDWPSSILLALRIGSDGIAAPGWDPDGVRVDADRDPGPGGYVFTLGPGLASTTPGRAFAVFDQQVHPWCGISEVCYDSYTYAQYLVTDGVVAALASLISADAAAGRARLEWQVSGPGPVTVERRREQTAWIAVGEALPDGAGRVVFEDATVAAGERYGYRLAIAGAGGVAHAGEAWVEVPARAALALAGPRPNPAGEGLTVVFSLPDDAPARLELFDLLGRRVAGREVGALGAGSHTVRLAAADDLGPGVYLVRLTRGGRALSARAVVSR